jgi:peptidoglycan/LPS O-acetylase OafA/YrhL
VRQKIPQLDAIRGIAILWVMFHNATRKDPEMHLQRVFDSGWMGVDLFFVLSGFLITGILLDTRRSEGYLGNFYARRILRIWPLYYFVLFLMFVAIPRVMPSAAAHIFSSQSSPWWAFPLFLQNFLLPAPDWAAASLGVAWSLGVEEQFYLVWPWLVRYCSKDTLRRVALSVICASPVLRLYLMQRHVHTYSNFFCRLDGLMAGAFLASLVSIPERSLPKRYTKLAWICLAIAGPLALITDSFDNRWLVHSLAVVAAASFLYVSLTSSNRWLQKVATNRFLVYTGTISYGLYLLHKIPIDALQMVWPDSHLILVLILGIGASYLLAALSWRLIERPFLGLKRFFPSKNLSCADLSLPATTQTSVAGRAAIG